MAGDSKGWRIVTFDEFLEKCREVDGWRLLEEYPWDRWIRNSSGECPLQAVFGAAPGYTRRARDAGLPAREIMRAADGHGATYREALLTLVGETP